MPSESTFESYTKIENKFGVCIIFHENKHRVRNYVSGNTLMSWNISHLYFVSPNWVSIKPCLGDRTVKVVSVVQLVWKILRIMSSFGALWDTLYIQGYENSAVKKHTELCSSQCFPNIFFLSQFLLWKPV